MRCFSSPSLLTVVCWFAEERPQRCIDWWEGMIYVAPLYQLSSGPLSLITAIRLALHRCSPCLRAAITASLLSHIHKGKGRILSPRLPLHRYRDAKKGASMCSRGLKVIIYHDDTRDILLPVKQRCLIQSLIIWHIPLLPTLGSQPLRDLLFCGRNKSNCF